MGDKNWQKVAQEALQTIPALQRREEYTMVELEDFLDALEAVSAEVNALNRHVNSLKE
jgi:hypothetical protein